MNTSPSWPVSIEAMGSQRVITKKIVDKESDYLLAVKGNQTKLHEAFQKHFPMHNLFNIRNHALRFSIERFQREFELFVNKKMANHLNNIKGKSLA